MKKLFLISLLSIIAANSSAGLFKSKQSPEKTMNKEMCNAGWADHYMPHFKSWQGINGALVANMLTARKIVSADVDQARTTEWLKGWEVTKVCIRGRGKAKKIGTVDIWANGIMSVPAEFSKSEEDEIHVWKVYWKKNVKQGTFSVIKMESFLMTNSFAMMKSGNTGLKKQ